MSADVAAQETPARSRRPVLFLVVAGLFAVAAVVAVVVGRGSTSAVPLAPDNPQPGGAQATATILRDQGVRIRTVSTTDDAVRVAGPGTTLLVTTTGRLDDAQLAAVRDTGADLVLGQPTFLPDLEPLTDRVEPSPVGSDVPVAAACQDPDATAAGRLSRSVGGVVALGDDVELCFPTAEGAGALATWEQDGRDVAVLADTALMSNEHLADAGNAALVLRLLGGNDELVWYLPTIGDTVGEDGAGTGGTSALVPPTVRVLGVQLLVLTAVVVLWGGRRLGRVVTEPMPVVVRSAETTLGRGRLYRRAHDHAHAAAGLRAGCATRVAARLGVPSSARAEALVAAVARATGREEAAVGALLYGPPPTSDAELVRLTSELDTLESEVHPS
ncbi:protein of unknown function [Georgenia satyanarayanai]|uniref:DUF4350 domain-containing protein n=1 Tax=Georgenia satyanarayanai TaxID=860221 RepID=A0A2Y9ALH2_9MICO|nr:DUF4350 domain-containing protein [Georgenia satyanarayanai]PYF99365.1 uncharacterized protein DUF4350 [Georgenia satyanarayanai]SSA43177.1 protein of unknown function [Georgenia satyanarayanai]